MVYDPLKPVWIDYVVVESYMSSNIENEKNLYNP